MQGRCISMCPPSQLTTHGVNYRLHALERWTTAEAAEAGCTHAVNGQSPVSAYRRSAGRTVNEQNDDIEQLFELRTCDTLLVATNHLVRCVTPRILPDLTFAEKYSYLSDRFRQIKKELTMQSSSHTAPLLTLAILEPIVRFYVVAGWVEFGADQTRFDASMNDKRTEDCLQELLSCCKLK